MKLLFSREWLRKKIEADPDGECEAGASHPEAPLNRIIVDHGVVHDTVIGRHIAGTPDSIAADGPEALRKYLISLIAR